MKIITTLAISLIGINFNILAPVSSTAEVQSVKFTLAQRLSPQEINLRAKQFTVRIDGTEIGTGIIIDQSPEKYKVLTNWHVVKNAGEYSLQTIDGRKHAIAYDSVQQLPNLDLAILEFDRKQNYQVAELGNSRGLVEGQNIYFAGYPGESRREDNRYYRFFSANVVGILPESNPNGYSLIYSGEPFPGMSGGPVLNSQGLLVGIHGETNVNAVTGGTSNYAIPINLYSQAIRQTAATTEEVQTPAPTASPPENANPNSVEAEKPSVTVETVDTNAQPTQSTEKNSQTEDNQASNSEAETAQGESKPQPTNNTTEKPQETSQESQQESPTGSQDQEIESSPTSVPTLTAQEKPEQEQPKTRQEEPKTRQEGPQKKRNPLISSITNINYTPLQKLLKSKKWESADRTTNQLIARIIDTAKQQNENSLITFNMIADYACQDLSTIDLLWRKYSNNKFGFSPQQKAWLSSRQDNDFSPTTWRSFATKIGWKTGNVSQSSGYLLYEQLSFDPKEAPQGHLPWWFATSDEQQKVIKTSLNRCFLQEKKQQRESPQQESDQK